MIILGALLIVIGTAVWLVFRNVDPISKDGLRSASITSNFARGSAVIISEESASQLADLLNSLSSARSGSFACGADQGRKYTVVFDASQDSTANVDIAGCLSVTIDRGSSEWHLDGSSKDAAGAVAKVLRSVGGGG